jgi:HAD superfamily hydrolase (TIGR01509 family)
VRPACLFELDGLLVDSGDAIVKAFRQAMKRHRGEPLPAPAAFRRSLGAPLADRLAEYGGAPDELEALAATYRKLHRSAVAKGVGLFPGVLPSVRSLAARGVGVGLVTGETRAETKRTLERHGLETLFGAIVTADDASPGKPDPAPVLRCMAELDADPRLTILVGATPVDLRAGRAAGVRVAAALWGPCDRRELAESEPDLFLGQPTELATLTWG